jgi:abequosyltransferase
MTPTSSTPLISFCIPTRNRANFLLKTLTNLAAQADPDCEYVIVDGASQDTTAEVVEQFARGGHRIVYFRRDESIGVDRDVLKAVELASGTYCWLMSDDDQLEPGAYRYVCEALRQNPDVAGASLNTAAYDATLSYRVRTVPAVSGGRITSDIVCQDRDQCFSLLGIHLGFISSQVVHRMTWLAAVAARDTSPFCNAWIIVYVIGEMLNRSPKWLYLHRECIAYRSGNDSFSARLGVYGRQLITHENYAFTLNALFGRDSQTCRAVLRTLISDRMGRTLAMIKADGASLKLQWSLATLYVRKYHAFPAFWLKVAPLFLVPNVLLRCVRWGYFLLCSGTLRDIVVHRPRHTL